MKKIAILGSTGSIGKQTIDIIRKDKKNFKKFSSIGSDIGLLFQIADDLIDQSGNSKKVGKKTKKDHKKGKAP